MTVLNLIKKYRALKQNKGPSEDGPFYVPLEMVIADLREVWYSNSLTLDEPSQVELESEASQLERFVAQVDTESLNGPAQTGTTPPQMYNAEKEKKSHETQPDATGDASELPESGTAESQTASELQSPWSARQRIFQIGQTPDERAEVLKHLTEEE